jgi:hypothetical protein
MSGAVVRNAVGLEGPEPNKMERNRANKAKMSRYLAIFVCLLLALPILGHSNRAPAQTSSGPMSGEITAACMQAMDETETICACIEEDAIATLTDDQQTFLVAIMTEDESLIDELRGTFTNEDAQLVQNQMVNAAMQCT